jgi:ectoine hydroxylase-related dioxygenase (phytanoyl-CoA dioxygenase family)
MMARWTAEERQAMSTTTLALTANERASYATQGFLVRRGVMDADDLARLRDATEDLCRSLVAEGAGPKQRASKYYVFQAAPGRDAYINGESADMNVVMGVEPVAHLHRVFEEYGSHFALTTPCRGLLGVEAIALFTEKLNVKRAGVGGAYALHQDFPYWKNGVAEEPARLVTALPAIDDATRENGALEVLPGSHINGEIRGKDSSMPFERNELDEPTFDSSGMVIVELRAGDAVFFGPFLVHRSSPNRSSRDRRAILYTYQRAGLKTQRDNARGWIAATANERDPP